MFKNIVWASDGPSTRIGPSNVPGGLQTKAPRATSGCM